LTQAVETLGFERAVQKGSGARRAKDEGKGNHGSMTIDFVLRRNAADEPYSTVCQLLSWVNRCVPKRVIMTRPSQ